MFLNPFLLALSPILALAGPVSKRIVGGQPAVLGQFKSLVSLTGVYENTDGLTQFCGGTLLNPTTVLTAAHCVTWVDSEPSDFNVRAGSLYYNQSGVASRVRSYVQHPQYANDNYDFAILKLATPIAECDNIKYARLQELDVDPVPGTNATIAGWGLDSDGGYRRPELYWVQVPIVDRATCRRDFASTGVNITEEEICAGVPEGGKGDCSGDSGGPLTVGGVVTGVVSFSQGCAQKGYPGVYARVSKAIPFIKQHL